MKTAPRRRLAPVEAAHPRISVVVPIYNEEHSIELLQEQLHTALAGLGRSYEVLYVDDGSRDGSARQLQSAVERYPHVRVIRFRRNFGQTAAIQAGIENSRGDVVVFLDGDLQNDPADIPRLLQLIDQGYDVVSGWRKNRQDTSSRRIPSRIANWLISRVTGVQLHDYGCTLKAYRRDVLEHVKLYGEMHRFIPAYASWAGAEIVEIEVNHRPRRYGRSKYGLSRTLRVLLDLMTVKMLGSYSTKPIYFFGFVGFGFWLLAFLCALEVIIEKLWIGTYAHRNPVLLLAVFLAIVGVQFVLMGLLAELSIRTYHESQDKPTYVVREILESKRQAS
ncbi:MAG TPA: glycosyltransferase family 2 protein [Candidatus Dormibacteraeota bacterium]